jgi:hypothetical protein
LFETLNFVSKAALHSMEFSSLPMPLLSKAVVEAAIQLKIELLEGIQEFSLIRIEGANPMANLQGDKSNKKLARISS